MQVKNQGNQNNKPAMGINVKGGHNKDKANWGYK